MDLCVVVVSEIAKALKVTPRYVQKMAKKESWTYENKNGRGDKVFEVEKLPEDVKVALAICNKDREQERTAGPLSLPRDIRGDGGYRTAGPPSLPGGSGTGRSPFPTNGGDGRIAVGDPGLADWQNRIALARADLIRAYLAHKARAKVAGQSLVEAADTWVQGYNTGLILPQVYQILGPKARQTIEAWCKSFKTNNHDFVTIAPQWGNRKGQRKVTEEEFNTLLSFALHPNRLRISQAVRLTKVALQKRAAPSPSSEDTMRRVLIDFKGAHYDQWIFCREGEKALNDKCLPYIERDAGFLDVGEVLVADGHTLNFQILHPFTGKPCRMTMIAWYDWASCTVPGFEIMPTENVQCVAAGLRRAILKLGKMPKVAYLDNGKAFKAKIFTDQAIDFEEIGFYGMFARLGIETIFAWPYNAQSKPIERFFGTFSELERLLPTFTGTSIEDKPAHMLRNERLHKALHEKKYNGWVPTIEEAVKIIEGWFEEYGRRPHRGLKGLAPGDVFEAGKGPGVDEAALRHMMMSMEMKAVGRNGVSFMGRNYYDEALYGHKDRVVIRYDMEDLSRILIYDASGVKLICEARPVAAVHPVARISGNADDLALVKEGIRRKRGLKRATEQVARAWVADAPRLVDVTPSPRPSPIEGEGDGTTRRSFPTEGAKWTPRPASLPVRSIPMPQGEVERIEAAAAKLVVLQPRKKEPLYLSEADRYEALIEGEFKGEALELDDMAFMRYFEGTSLFQSLKDRFEMLKEYWVDVDSEAAVPPGD